MNRGIADTVINAGCLPPCPGKRVSSCKSGYGRSWQTNWKQYSLAFSKTYDKQVDVNRDFGDFKATGRSE